VIIHDVPLEPESYVHRIGRTGRAGLSGHAIMFCDAEEIKYLRQGTKLIGKEIRPISNDTYNADIESLTIALQYLFSQSSILSPSEFNVLLLHLQYIKNLKLLLSIFANLLFWLINIYRLALRTNI